MNKLSESSIFCTRPFTSLFVASDGGFRFCCVDYFYFGEDEIIPKSYNIRNTDLHELWNSEKYKKIRSKLLNEIKPKVCTKCFQQTSSNSNIWQEARRTIDFKLGKDYDGYREYMDLSAVTFIELWFSNKCNLQCRMCNPYNSDQLIDQWNDMISSNDDMKKTQKLLSDEDKSNLHQRDWTTSESAWENLSNFVKKIFENNPNHTMRFILSGGEPMLCEGMYKFFDFCIKHKISKNIDLTYNTNLTILPSKMLEYWKHFSSVALRVSVDGYQHVNEYIRYPSKWNKLISNIVLLRSLNEKKHIRIDIIPTIQAYNILTITKLYDWCIQTSFQENIETFINQPKFEQSMPLRHLVFMNPSTILFAPKILNVRVLPKELKIIAVKRIQEFLSKNISNPFVSAKQKHFVYLINYLLSEDWSHLFPDFIKYTKHLDKTRNQNIIEIMPEIEKYLS